jgi:hypothetical protein
MNKAEVAKLKVELKAAEKGWITSRTIEGARYDLVLDDRSRLYRVQVKYVSGVAGNSVGCVQVGLRRWAGDSRDQPRGRTRIYTASEVDVLLVYVPQVDKLCWFGADIFAGRPSFNLRYEPTKNGQKAGLILVQDFVW